MNCLSGSFEGMGISQIFQLSFDGEGGYICFDTVLS